MTRDPYFIYTVLSVISLIACAAGIALSVVTKFLDESNNLGDSYGSFDDHCRTVLFEEERRSDISYNEARRFLSLTGDNPFDTDATKAPEALLKNDDIYGELEDVDIPLFKPLDG